MSTEPTTGRWPDYEDIYEDDGFGEYTGAWMGLHLHGHIDDETATAYAWAIMADDYRDNTLAAPQRTWVRKVPRDGGCQYVYSGPGRGASPVTLLEVAHGWQFWCDVHDCSSRFVRGSARSGVSIKTFANPEAWFPPSAEPQDARQPEYRYLCRAHAARYEEAMREARAAALAAYHESLEAVS